MKKNIVSLTLLALSMAFTSTLANAVTPTNTIVCTLKGPLGVDSVGTSVLKPFISLYGYQAIPDGVFYDYEAVYSDNPKTLVIEAYAHASVASNGVFAPVKVSISARSSADFRGVSEAVRAAIYDQASSQTFRAPFAELEAGGIDRVLKVPARYKKKWRTVEAKAHCAFGK
jgi:hypothetical protein